MNDPILVTYSIRVNYLDLTRVMWFSSRALSRGENIQEKYLGPVYRLRVYLNF